MNIGKVEKLLSIYRVGTLITEGSSHRTALVLFTYGSSETRVMTPMVGITTSTIQNAHTYCIGF